MTENQDSNPSRREFIKATGRTRDDMLNCEHEFAPTADILTADWPAPLVAGANGKYPAPEPGIRTTREF